MKIGSKIRELRREKMWTQKDLGNAIGMSSHTIAMWEGGKSIPSENARKELAKMFGVPVDYLMKGGEEKPSDGSDEAKALLKVAENEINQLKADKEKMMNEIASYKNEIVVFEEKIKRLREVNVDLKNEITFLKGEPAVVREDTGGMKKKIDELMEENYKLKETIVHLAMKGALN